MDFKPTVFIGSSTEGLATAELVSGALQDFAECILWKDAFDFGASNFNNLADKIAFYDYAILIATADDVTLSRGKKTKSTRDNVLFEFGLFAGGLGAAKTFYMIEEGIKIPSDLLGITLPFIPKRSEPDYQEKVEQVAVQIRNSILSMEQTFHLGFVPSTAIAYGYFENFVARTVTRLLEDKADGKVFVIDDATSFSIKEIRFTVLVPNDLSDNMFDKVYAKRLRDGWKKLKVDPKHIRDYDFSVDISKVEDGIMHLVDIPFTLNALNKCVELYSKKAQIGKHDKETLLEAREIRNFVRTLRFLISTKAMTKGIVDVEIVDI
jgi:hypothetical protein